jgi:uncharacterized membrane protein
VDPHAAQWLNLALRWMHVITGVAWIGTSFYFNWLNSRLHAPTAPEPGVGGELWSVHGGGFYRVVKYDVAPANVPPTLHWFMWEAYATWTTGVLLLTLIYYVGARSYLIDPAVAPISTGLAIAIGVATIIGSWLVYDLLCRSPLAQRPAALAAVGILLIGAVAYGLAQVFSARAAYMHIGAALGSIMANNVSRVIIPGQRAMVNAMTAGRTPDAARGQSAALRSLHNNYLTLPVLFVMVSGHYPATYGSTWGWAILVGLFLVGVAARHWFNLRNQGRRNPWLLPAAGAVLIVLAIATAPRVPAAASGTIGSFAEVRVIIAQRCAACHSAAPTQPGFAAAQGGLSLDSPEQIRAAAPQILERAVVAKTMPLGNATAMTDAERELLGAWIRGGAALR